MLQFSGMVVPRTEPSPCPGWRVSRSLAQLPGSPRFHWCPLGSSLAPVASSSTFGIRGTASHGFCSSCGQAVAASHGPEWRGSQLPSCSRPLMGTAPAGLFPWVFGPPHPLGFLLWPRVLWVLWLTLSPPVSSSILWEGLVLAAPCRPLGKPGLPVPPVTRGGSGCSCTPGSVLCCGVVL